MGEAASDVVGVDAVVEEGLDFLSDVSDDAAGGSFGAAVEPFADEVWAVTGGVCGAAARRRDLRFSFLYQKRSFTFYLHLHTPLRNLPNPSGTLPSGLLGFVDLLFCGFGVQGLAVTLWLGWVRNGLVERVGRPFLEGFLEGSGTLREGFREGFQ